MPSRCSPGLCGELWGTPWRALPGRKKGTTAEVGVHRKAAQDPGRPRFPPAPVCRPQLQDRGSNSGVPGGSGRLDDPAPGAMAECGIPEVYPDSAR